MPFKVWTLGEEVLSADFQALVQQQVVATFATTAARDAAITAPVVGQCCFITGKGILVWQGAGIGWTPPWSVPWGVPPGGHAEDNHTVTNAGLALVDAPLLTTTVTFIAGRRYTIEANVQMSTHATASPGQLIIARASDNAVLEAGEYGSGTFNGWWTVFLRTGPIQPVGTFAHKIRFAPVNSPGESRINANGTSSVQYSHMTVRDIGPA
jgi:hypothetical protein